MSAEGCFDGHVHSGGSNDGAKPIEELIDAAKENNVEYMSVTDHNTFSEIRKFYRRNGYDLSTPIVEFDGVKIISGVEVTCRINDIKNLSGNSTKVHLLVYGADMSPSSPLSQLLEIKRKNDLDCDIGLLRDVLHLYGHYEITEDEIREYIRDKRKETPGYSSISKNDVWNFLNERKITVATSYKEFLNKIDDLPRYERLNIDAGDLIKVAHASGGLVIPAHLAPNLARTTGRRNVVDYLLSQQVDGFEMFYESATPATTSLIRDCIRSRGQRKPVFTGGSDTHDFSHGNSVGRVNGKPLSIKAVSAFISEINRLANARYKGHITHKEYRDCDEEQVKSIIKYYKEYYNQIVTNSKPTLPSGFDSRKPKKNKGKKNGNGSRYTKEDRRAMREERDWNKSLAKGEILPKTTKYKDREQEDYSLENY